MEAEKKSINVSQNLVSAIITGLVLSICLVIILHFFGSWSVSTAGLTGSYINANDKVSYYWYTCPLGGYHHFDGDGKTTWNDIFHDKSSSARVSGAFAGAFDGHWLAIFVFAAIFAGLILFFKNFKLTVS